MPVPVLERCKSKDPRYEIRCVLKDGHSGEHQGRGGPVWKDEKSNV